MRLQAKEKQTIVDLFIFRFSRLHHHRLEVRIIGICNFKLLC